MDNAVCLHSAFCCISEGRNLATVRIYKVAELLNTTSQEVTALLKRDHGIEVKSASSTIEEVVARQFVERLARQRNISLPSGDIFAETPVPKGREGNAAEEGSRTSEAHGPRVTAAPSGQDSKAGRRTDGRGSTRRGARGWRGAHSGGAHCRGDSSRCRGISGAPKQASRRRYHRHLPSSSSPNRPWPPRRPRRHQKSSLRVASFRQRCGCESKSSGRRHRPGHFPAAHCRGSSRGRFREPSGRHPQRRRAHRATSPTPVAARPSVQPTTRPASSPPPRPSTYPGPGTRPSVPPGGPRPLPSQPIRPQQPGTPRPGQYSAASRRSNASADAAVDIRSTADGSAARAGCPPDCFVNAGRAAACLAHDHARRGHDGERPRRQARHAGE